MERGLQPVCGVLRRVVPANRARQVTIIDFPQMVSVSHANAQELFDRDVECIVRWAAGPCPDRCSCTPQGRRDVARQAPLHTYMCVACFACWAPPPLLPLPRRVACRFFSKKVGYMPENDPALPYVRPSFDAAGATGAAGLALPG